MTELPDGVTQHYEDDSYWHRMSVVQWLNLQRGKTAVQHPVYCHICGAKTRGNIIIGFWPSCEH